MLLSVIASSIVLQGKPIDFRPDVGTAPNIIAQLASASGMKLSTAPNVANDVIAVVAPNRPAREIMDQIAYALEAEWKAQEDGWILARSESTIKAQEQNDRDRTIAEIKRAISKLPEPQPWGPNEAAKVAGQVNLMRGQSYNATAFRALRDSMPEHRILIKLLKATPADTFAIPFASRTVFATNPNRRQQPMPLNLESSIKEMRMESAALAKAWIEPAEGMAHLFYAPNLHEITKVLLSVTRSSLDGLAVRMTGYNRAGTEVFAANQTLPNNLGDLPTPERTTDADREIPLRPVSRDLLKTTLAAMSDRYHPPTGELKEWLARPKEKEPLALINTEAMRAIAEEEKKPVVAVIPEAQLYAAASLAPNAKLTTRRYRQSLTATQLVQEERDGWVAFRESNPHLGRQHRVHRPTLENYYRRIEREEKSGLDSFAEFVLKHPTLLEATLFPLHRLVNGFPRETYPYSDDLSIVRLYGTLTADQKNALRAERHLALGDFSSAQVAILSKMYYNARHQSYQYDPVSEEARLSPMSWITVEPTEAHPNGLSAPFSMSAKVYDEAAVFRRGLTGETMPFSASNIAWELYQRERQDLFPQPGGRGVQGEYFEGRVIQWPFKFRVTPTLSFYTRLTEHSLNPGGPRTFDGMPKSFRDQVMEDLARFRREYAHLRPGDGTAIRRGSGPPPQ
jgi:hypothetical protein